MRNKALSPFISTILIILIGVVAITLILSIVKPSLDKARDSAIINEAFQNLNLIDDNIREVVSEGIDSKRTIKLSVVEGKYQIDSDIDYINFTYNMKTGVDISGQKGEINVTRVEDKLNLFLSYDQIDIRGTDHFNKGENSIIISHEGINSTNNYPIIYVGK